MTGTETTTVIEGTGTVTRIATETAKDEAAVVVVEMTTGSRIDEMAATVIAVGGAGVPRVQGGVQTLLVGNPAVQGLAPAPVPILDLARAAGTERSTPFPDPLAVP